MNQADISRFYNYILIYNPNQKVNGFIKYIYYMHINIISTSTYILYYINIGCNLNVESNNC